MRVIPRERVGPTAAVRPESPQSPSATRKEHYRYKKLGRKAKLLYT